MVDVLKVRVHVYLLNSNYALTIENYTNTCTSYQSS